MNSEMQFEVVHATKRGTSSLLYIKRAGIRGACPPESEQLWSFQVSRRLNLSLLYYENSCFQLTIQNGQFISKGGQGLSIFGAEEAPNR